MANIFRTPLFSPPPIKARFPGLVEVVSSFVLSTLALHTIAPVPDLQLPSKKPVYIQTEQVQAPVLTTLRLNTLAPIADIPSFSRRPIYQQIDQILNLPLNTLRQQVGFPFFAVDLGSPSKRPIASEPYQVQAPVLNLLALNILAPILDQPNPSRRPIYNQIDLIPNLNTTTLLPVVLNTYLLSLPLDELGPSKRPIALQPDQVQAPVLTTLLLKPQQRVPLILDTPKRSVAQEPLQETVPSVLLQISPVIPPFILPLQENPSRRLIAPEPYQVQIPNTLIPAFQSVPFFQSDFPNPIRDLDLKAHTFTAVVVFGPSPFNLIDQPNPSPRKIYNQQIESGPNNLVLGIPVATPFNQVDQPSPSRRSIYYQDQNGYAALTLGLPVPAKPFNQTDQPNPSRRPISYQDQNVPIPLTLGLPTPPPPFYQTNQPNPSRRAISYQDQNGYAALTLGIPIPPPPFYQTDFINAIQGQVRQQPDSVSSLLLSTLVPISVLPFANYDWPNPQRLHNIYNSGIFDFGGSVYGLGNPWSIIATGSGTWSVITAGSNTWAVVVTGSNPWTNINPTKPTGNSGGVT